MCTTIRYHIYQIMLQLINIYFDSSCALCYFVAPLALLTNFGVGFKALEFTTQLFAFWQLINAIWVQVFYNTF